MDMCRAWKNLGFSLECGYDVCECRNRELGGSSGIQLNGLNNHRDLRLNSCGGR